jgi:DNA polymerase
MEKDLNKIVEDSISYLKYIKDNTTYDLFSDHIKNKDEEVTDKHTAENYTSQESVEKKTFNKHAEVSYPLKKPEEENVLVRDKHTIRRNTSLSLLREDWMDVEDLTELDKMICNCYKCNLGKLRTNFVFGAGNSNADVVLVGEAPGAEEDKQGIPFVGRAGKLLTDILKAINFTRDEVYICNILKCRPPGNRNPLPEEIGKCEPYLLRQLELIKPKFILSLGAFASQTLLNLKEPLGKMRGKIYDFIVGDEKIKLMVTYHPAALLRNPNWKKPTWQDVQLFRKEYDKVVKN